MKCCPNLNGKNNKVVDFIKTTVSIISSEPLC